MVMAGALPLPLTLEVFPLIYQHQALASIRTLMGLILGGGVGWGGCGQ